MAFLLCLLLILMQPTYSKYTRIQFSRILLLCAYTGLYVRMMNDVIDQIEENISQQITLQSLSERFYMSEGTLVLKETYIYLDTFYLSGIYFDVNENDADFEDTLKTAGETFASAAPKPNFPKQEQFYTVVNCHGDESGKYIVFFGEGPFEKKNENDPGIRKISSGWYARFSYHGDMLDMRSTLSIGFLSTQCLGREGDNGNLV